MLSFVIFIGSNQNQVCRQGEDYTFTWVVTVVHCFQAESKSQDKVEGSD